MLQCLTLDFNPATWPGTATRQPVLSGPLHHEAPCSVDRCTARPRAQR